MGRFVEKKKKKKRLGKKERRGKRKGGYKWKRTGEKDGGREGIYLKIIFIKLVYDKINNKVKRSFDKC